MHGHGPGEDDYEKDAGCCLFRCPRLFVCVLVDLPHPGSEFPSAVQEDAIDAFSGA